MVRLPYDNFQSHEVKYVDYKVEEPISIADIVTGPQETKTREVDDKGVSVLKELHDIDKSITQYQRITQVQNKNGIHIGHMSSDELVELELDTKGNLAPSTFRIVDIKSQQYGTGVGNMEYTGIFPIITTAPMALYYQEKIENTTEFDKCLDFIDLENGIEMSTKWFRKSDPLDDKFKALQAQLVESIRQEVNFNTSTSKFHRNESFQDVCVKKFPLMNFIELNKLDKSHMSDIGLLVCGLQWDDDMQQSKLVILESYVGKLKNGPNSIDRKINSSSKYIRMYKNLSITPQTDYFTINSQKITSIGMESTECGKYVNYKTSILDPISFMLEHVLSDIDSIQIDTILDCGISSIAFAAYVAKNEEGESFKTNQEVRTRIDWYRNEYTPEEHLQDYALVWDKITRLFGDFCKNVRGDCVYVADGPRILNLERNYPIRNYTDMENIEMFNKFLPYFNGYTNNYVAKYWNWVYIEDMQYDNRGFWVPGSVIMGSQLAINDHNGEIWYAPAGQTRGLVPYAYDVSVKTKSYNQENDILYQNNWNFFQIYQNEGVVVEGQKTLQTKKTSLDRLNVRRMVCYIKQQIRIISNKYKYEPNTKSMRDSYGKELSEMLRRIQRTSGISDFIVVCNDTNNSIESIDRHELYCKIGIKPIKAIEYIIIDLNVINGTISMGEV